MTPMTQTLQVVPIDKDSPRPAMGLDVVNVRRRHAESVACALAAKRLAQELLRAEIVAPNRELIPPVPLGSGSTALLPILGLMLRAKRVARQRRAALMRTRAGGLLCHGLSPPSKTITPEPSTLDGSSAQALKAQALDVNDGRLLALFAVQRQVCGAGIR